MLLCNAEKIAFSFDSFLSRKESGFGAAPHKIKKQSVVQIAFS
jgi:hypothetical protein